MPAITRSTDPADVRTISSPVQELFEIGEAVKQLSCIRGARALIECGAIESIERMGANGTWRPQFVRRDVIEREIAAAWAQWTPWPPAMVGRARVCAAHGDEIRHEDDEEEPTQTNAAPL
jgi:hypothetical protein